MSTEKVRRVFGLIGHPVGHSMSPVMHQAAFDHLGIDGSYHLFDVAPPRLAEAIKGARALGIGGMSVTVPHKEGAFEHCSELDESAILARAVNTLVPVDGGWRGYNTDSAGFVRALAEDLDFDPRGCCCLMLGAGGAARGGLVGLAAAGAARIYVVARDVAKGGALAKELSAAFGATEFVPVGLSEALTRCGDAELVISATPLGLDPDGRWPWPPGGFGAKVRFYDMAYSGSGMTPLEVEAREGGRPVASGLNMLLFQGVEAFTLWTGVEPPVGVMKRALIEAMSDRV